MNKFNCPACKKKAMSNWEKLILSPFQTKSCACCGIPLTVPLYTIVIPLVPIIPLLIISLRATDSNINPALPVLGLAVTLFLLNLVPLKAKL